MIVNQKQACEMIGVTANTLRSYEKRGLLKRYDTPRPGAWYRVSDLRLFLPVELRGVQQASSKTNCATSNGGEL